MKPPSARTRIPAHAIPTADLSVSWWASLVRAAVVKRAVWLPPPGGERIPYDGWQEGSAYVTCTRRGTDQLDVCPQDDPSTMESRLGRAGPTHVPKVGTSSSGLRVDGHVRAIQRRHGRLILALCASGEAG